MQNLCPQPEEVIANNEDLLTQILLCLPARSLLRCKCISKQWHSLISNRKFCDRHTLQNPNSKISAFFFNKSKIETYYISLPHNENPSGCPPTPLNFIQDPAGIQILQSCNGLLLCGTCCQVNTTRRYYVVNPTTNQFFKLPATSKSTNIWCVSLAFDPSKSLHYKVICVRNAAAYLDYPQLQVELEIYSSKTRSWRLGISTFLDAVDAFGIDFSHGVYCNGAIHWINRAGVLLHYDIDEACFRVVHSLPGYENGEHRYFGESGGHLYRVETFRPYITQFVVLEMERDYSGWSVKYHVDLHLIISAFPEMVRDYYDPSDCYSYSFVVLFVALEESEEDSTLLLHIPCKLISYNLRDKTFKKLCDLTPIGTQTKKCLQVGWNTYHYMETLACV